MPRKSDDFMRYIRPGNGKMCKDEGTIHTIYLAQKLFISILKIIYLNALSLKIFHVFVADCFEGSAAETRIALS